MFNLSSFQSKPKLKILNSGFKLYNNQLSIGAMRLETLRTKKKERKKKRKNKKQNKNDC